MHYAVVKCEREEIMWKYYDNRIKIKLYRDKTYEELKVRTEKQIKDEYVSPYYSTYDNLKDKWKYAIDSHGIDFRRYRNGLCVLWEGNVNQERLRASDYLYIPTVKKHLRIDKVETNPDGSIVYYVNYIKLFNETGEESRLKAIEDWLSAEYPEVKKFSDMNQYKDSVNEYEKEYDDFEENKEMEIRKELYKQFKDREITDNKKPNYEITYIKDEADETWQSMIMYGGIGVIVLLVLVIIGLNIN